MSLTTKKVTITLPEKDFHTILFHLNKYLSVIQSELDMFKGLSNKVPLQYYEVCKQDLIGLENTYFEVISLKNKLNKTINGKS